MANLTESAQFDSVYQIETTDSVVGGPGGISNRQAQELANRTRYLKNQVESTQSALSTHEGAVDPHPQYLTAAEVNSIYQPLDSTLTAVAGLMGTADKIPYFTGADALALTTLTSFARSILDDTDAAAVRSTLGVPGTDSPTFTGNPIAPTPALFDNDTSVATTAFVQRALGNFQNYTGLTGNNTLTTSQAGGVFEITSGSTGTTTLPAASSKAGICYTINNTSAYVQTIASQGGNFYGNGVSGVTNYAMPAGTTLQYVSDGANWKILSGSGANYLSANGYQKLPGGLIFQWGRSQYTTNTWTTTTFPITFPTACQSISMILEYTGGTVYAFQLNQSSLPATSSFQHFLGPAQSGLYFRWFAIGY